jgi:phage/plasmid-associated DNA primase
LTLEIPAQNQHAGTPADYRDEEDVIGEFIEERCLWKGEVERTELYAAYKDWGQYSGAINYPLGPNAFAKRLRRPGISERKSSERYWVGISLIQDNQASISFRRAA